VITDRSAASSPSSLSSPFLLSPALPSLLTSPASSVPSSSPDARSSDSRPSVGPNRQSSPRLPRPDRARRLRPAARTPAVRDRRADPGASGCSGARRAAPNSPRRGSRRDAGSSRRAARAALLRRADDDEGVVRGLPSDGSSTSPLSSTIRSASESPFSAAQAVRNPSPSVRFPGTVDDVKQAHLGVGGPRAHARDLRAQRRVRAAGGREQDPRGVEVALVQDEEVARELVGQLVDRSLRTGGVPQLVFAPSHQHGVRTGPTGHVEHLLEGAVRDDR